MCFGEPEILVRKKIQMRVRKSGSPKVRKKIQIQVGKQGPPWRIGSWEVRKEEYKYLVWDSPNPEGVE